MAQLIVRKLDRRVVSALKTRAARHGQSAEAEHRAILEHALLGAPPEQDFKSYLRAMPDGADLRLHRTRDRGRRVRL